MVILQGKTTLGCCTTRQTRNCDAETRNCEHAQDRLGTDIMAIPDSLTIKTLFF
jgi:hypothetical protein